MTNQPFQPLPDEPVFIGFVGRMGSGKTSAATYVSSKHDFQYIRYSQVLQKWLAANGEGKDRLQQIGWEVMAAGLQAELNARLIEALDPSRSAAIDGLRHSIDFHSLSSTFGAAFGIVFLEAPEELRYARLKQRFVSQTEFQEADSHPVEMHIDDFRSLATLKISNESSLKSLYEQLDRWIETSVLRDRA